MVKEERFQVILQALKASGKISLETLARQLAVSADTIRRDIDTLGRSGLLVKVRGGAIRPSVNPLAFQDRAALFSEAKQIIALKAQHLLRDARTVFIDGGTTMLAVIASLPLQAQLRIITNNVALVPLLASHPHVELIVLGGLYNRLTKTTLGVQTALEAQKYHADLYLMGICALSPIQGVTATVHEDGELKKVFMQAAQKTAALVNHEKLGTHEFFQVGPLTRLHLLVTDLPSDDARLAPYRTQGLEIW